MNSIAAPQQLVQLAPNFARIQGRSEIMLCASLFYFRIPRGHWRDRMQQLRAYGYNCIDVYFPWNYHETREGVWDFEGEKDIAAFLEIAAEVGLWVVARPGPYICSEWDGGGLPAYLHTQEGMVIRDNNQPFLNAVTKWFDRVMPVLARYQLGEAGTIICVQLDNELDFYGCRDPKGYISALRDMALAHGIKVPLIACAGQGGLLEASGLAEEVMPTCNFYPNDRDPTFEDKVLTYKRVLAEQGYPLLVTETNRSHFLLRRLLSCGAKLLGPYLQVSGTDFGFTNATNNWGRPLAFLTSDYDFGGMISPEGHVRPEAYEGLMLARLIRTYGSALTEAEPVMPDSDGVLASAKFIGQEDDSQMAAADHARAAAISVIAETGVISSQTLKLAGGGRLIFISNLGGDAAIISFRAEGDLHVPNSQLELKPWRSVALPFDVPLRNWGIDGKLLYSTAELFHHVDGAAGSVLALHAEHGCEIALHLPGAKVLAQTNLTVHARDDMLILHYASGDPGSCDIETADGTSIRLYVMSRQDALRVEEIDTCGNIRLRDIQEPSREPVKLAIPWSIVSLPGDEPPAGGWTRVDGRLDHLETYGIYRGFTWLEASVNSRQVAARQGLLIRRGSDVISLYADRQYIATVVPGGSSSYIPAPSPSASGRLAARLEIWGHSNFDDVRMPSLRLSAMRGLRDLVSVTRVIELTQNWRVKLAEDRQALEQLADATLDDRTWPIVGYGGWLSPHIPQFACYRRSFELSQAADSWTMHLSGLEASARVIINGCDIGPVYPSDPFIDITPYVKPGGRVQATVLLEKLPGQAAGRVRVYEGTAASEWRLANWEEGQLWAAASSLTTAQADASELPITMMAGETAWLLGELRDDNAGRGWRIKADGANIKLTVLFNSRIVGRLWLKGSKARPQFTGGSQDTFYVPGPWFSDGAGKLAILLEALDGEEPPMLESLSFIPVSDPVAR